jgi:hypothetical protein
MDRAAAERPVQVAALENLGATWGNLAPQDVERWLSSVLKSQMFEQAAGAIAYFVAVNHLP